MVWHFIGVYRTNRTLHDPALWNCKIRYMDDCLEIQIFSSCAEKYFTRSQHSLMKHFSTLEEKFCNSALPCNILYVLSGQLAIPGHGWLHYVSLIVVTWQHPLVWLSWTPNSLFCLPKVVTFSSQLQALDLEFSPYVYSKRNVVKYSHVHCMN